MSLHAPCPLQRKPCSALARSRVCKERAQELAGVQAKVTEPRLLAPHTAGECKGSCPPHRIPLLAPPPPHQVLCWGLAQPLLPKASEPQFPQGLLSRSHTGAVSRCSPTRPLPITGQAPLKVLRPGRAASARRALPGLALPSYKPAGDGPARTGAPPVGPSTGLGDSSRQCAPCPLRLPAQRGPGRGQAEAGTPCLPSFSLSRGGGNGGPSPSPTPGGLTSPEKGGRCRRCLRRLWGRGGPSAGGSLVLTAKGATPRGRGRQQGLPRATKPGAM